MARNSLGKPKVAQGTKTAPPAKPKGTRNVRKPRTFKVGDKDYRVGTKATRTATVSEDKLTKVATFAKQAGATIKQTVTRSAEGTKGFRIGKFAKAHVQATDPATGTTTYKTKNGGTKTVSLAVTPPPNTKNKGNGKGKK